MRRDDMNSVNKLMQQIKRAKRESKKNDLFLSVYGLERRELIEAMILSAHKGFYCLETLQNVIKEQYGLFASLEVTEKTIRGIQALYPSRIYVAFTLGLNEIEIY
jgi:hypothetical protein